jgi:oligosaccharide repeat unit polymerase
MNPFIRQGFKIIMAVAYVNAFFLIKNIINKKKTRNNFFMVLSCVSAVVVTIFSGSRTEILRLLSAIILMYSVIWREKKTWKRKSINKRATKEIIKKMAIPIALVIAIAFLSRAIVKTRDVATSQISGIFDYMIFYIGSPLAVLNNKINKAFCEGGLLTGNSVSKSITGSHVYLGSLNYGGNVSSLFCTVLSEGLFLMVLRIFITFLIFEILYKSFIIKTKNNKSRNRVVIIFSMFYFVFTTSFYSYNVSLTLDVSSIIIMIFTIAYYQLLVKNRFDVYEEQMKKNC